MTGARIGVIGATSLVGRCILDALAIRGIPVTAFSRTNRHGTDATSNRDWEWLDAAAPCTGPDIPLWICAAPIWTLPEHFERLRAHGARKVVALSSTSRFSKQDSGDAGERALATRLAEAEAALETWARASGIEWVVLRPTLIYGFGRDKNVAEIARFIRRFGFFPLLGRAAGRRQPVHALDVAAACIDALLTPRVAGRAYNLSGGDILAYRELVSRIFQALGKTPRLLPVPLFAFAGAVRAARCLPRFRGWTPAMAERMNRDLVFDHADACADFGFQPRPFRPTAADVEDVA